MEDAITGPRMFVIDDEIKDAEGYVRHCRISELLDNVAYITDIDSLSNLLLGEKLVEVFWVDLSLGLGREDEGMLIIELIKLRCPEALIIVHTAHKDMEERCLMAGAHHFFVKGRDYEMTMEKINGIIKEFLKRNGIKINIIEYNAVIAEIKEHWVKLECSYKGNEIVRTFPIDPIKEALAGDMALDKVVKVKVIHRQNEIKITFEKGEEIDQGETGENADLRDSGIWSNKLS